MAGIIGIQGEKRSKIAHDMLNQILYRGKKHNYILLKEGLTLGFTVNDINTICKNSKKANVFTLSHNGDSTSIGLMGKKLSLKRDKYGVEPLYYLILDDNCIAFASEVKALLPLGTNVKELEPGCILEDLEVRKYYDLTKEEPISLDQRKTSGILRDTLISAINKRLHGEKIGGWLSGGLDSSAIAALVRSLVNEFHTFSVGFSDAEDLKYAKIVADHIGAIHHERIISFDDVLKYLPDVIYHLESFDALLVRSSVMNYAVSKLASEYVDLVYSGEGGDELFAGYEYIKHLPITSLPDELIDITKRLHNTALQRVDRCATAFGTTAAVPFMDEDVVDLAIRIPVEYKLKDGVEKWILRVALVDYLPTNVLMRTKSKFWEGSGIGERLFKYAEGLIPDSEFQKEKNIKCGWELNSKEELMYYRLFKEHFGELDNLDWMGRTKIIHSNGEDEI